jgi:hypothetical protein
VLVGDRAAADRAQVLRAPAFLGETVAKARVRVEVGRRCARHIADLEAAQPVADVGGVSDLAHLAVRDQVDPGIGLVADAICHRVADHLLVALAVDVLAAVLAEHHVNHILGAGKAADVGGEDPAAVGHLRSFPLRKPLCPQV